MMSGEFLINQIAKAKAKARKAYRKGDMLMYSIFIRIADGLRIRLGNLSIEEAEKEI